MRRDRNLITFIYTHCSKHWGRAMQFKCLRLFFVSVFFVNLFCIGCGSPEEKARVMLNKALVLKNQNELTEAGVLLRGIVSKYPETKVATEAINMLEGIRVMMFAKVIVLENQYAFREAEGLCKRIISEHPGTSEAIGARRRLMRNYNMQANSDVKNAYIAAQAYFMDNPTGSVDSTEVLSAYGFRQTTNVSVNPNGAEGTLQIITYHGSGNRTYTAASDGYITNN